MNTQKPCTPQARSSSWAAHVAQNHAPAPHTVPPACVGAPVGAAGQKSAPPPVAPSLQPPPQPLQRRLWKPCHLGAWRVCRPVGPWRKAGVGLLQSQVCPPLSLYPQGHPHSAPFQQQQLRWPHARAHVWTPPPPPALARGGCRQAGAAGGERHGPQSARHQGSAAGQRYGKG